MLTLLGAGQGQNNSFDADYQAILNKAISLGYTLPSASQRIKQNNLVLSLKSAGIWAKEDVIYVLATDGSSSFATLNWKNPNANQATLVNSPTFTTNQGFTGNGTSSYINTNFNPAIGTNNYKLNDASRHIFVRVQDPILNALEGIPSGNSNATLGINTTLLRINQGATSFTTAADFSGSNLLKSIHRTSVSNIELFTGTTQSSRTFNSTAISNDPQIILALRTGGVPNYGASQVSYYSMGASLVAENTNYVNIINTYLNSL